VLFLRMKLTCRNDGERCDLLNPLPILLKITVLRFWIHDRMDSFICFAGGLAGIRKTTPWDRTE